MAPINLGEDVTYCPGKNYSFNAHAGYKQYLWQDGSVDSIFIAKAPGKYFVNAKDYCNRIHTDTVIISEATFSLYAGKDTSICQFEKLQLNATQGFSKYTWSPAYRISNIVGNTVTVSPEITTSYSVSAEKFPGCVLKDTITVTIKDCPNQFFIPNAFSPNRDSKNDIFKPIITGTISDYEFSIYNRWGQLVFKSIDKNNGWDGTLKGLNQSGNVFVWICKFRFSAGELQIKKGTVLLIR
jgi:gliding motility-associated-like protein